MSNLVIPRTLPGFLEQSTEQFGSKTALIFEERHYTYNEINSRAELVARVLTSLTQKQDVVSLLLPNSPEFLIGYFGILKSGCIALIHAANISDTSLIFQIEKTSPRVIISEKKYLDKLERCSILRHAIFVDVHELPETLPLPKRRVSSQDVSSIIFTSGTTSTPKGVKLQHYNVAAATKNVVEYLGWSSEDIDVNISSLSHSFGLGHVHCVFAVGGTVVLFRDAINLPKILESFQKYKATTFGAVPAILRMLLLHYKEQFADCGLNLRFIQTNTSPLEKELVEQILGTFPNANFCYYYGLSEASRASFITFSRSEPQRFASAGKASPNVSIKIVDPEDKKLASREIGEICIKGEMVIREYWQNPEASKQIKEGWFHTGDVGYLDDDGYLFFKGRIDDVINVSGEKVFPEEVEDLIRSLDGITDVAIIGIPDKLFGEVIKAYISVSEPNFNTESVLDYCKHRLESYKIPRQIEIIDTIPRTDNGKLQRKLLKNRM